jgi:hypothetical protein
MIATWVSLRPVGIFVLFSAIWSFSVWAQHGSGNPNVVLRGDSAKIRSDVAQDNTDPAAKVMKDAAKKGFPLTSSTDVTGDVSVEAVLIPARIGKTVFGKETSSNYAIIALTISNRSPDESFMVHGVFIDYSQWLLSGGLPYSAPQPFPTPKKREDPMPPWQQSTLGIQIDSVENGIVRRGLPDREPWTNRNWVLRALQGAGSIATGVTLVTSRQSRIRGIGASNGSAIPAARAFWPDATVAQINRISDFGFQVNKAIPKQSSDIVVAFCPINRFVPPDLAPLFVSSPSVLFAPLASSLDPKVSARIGRYIKAVLNDAEIKNWMDHEHQVMSGQCEVPKANAASAASGSLQKACQTAELVSRLSLNVVRVRVSGTMTVDVNKVPPHVREVDLGSRADKDASFWKKGKKLTGVIRGSFRAAVALLLLRTFIARCFSFGA